MASAFTARGCSRAVRSADTADRGHKRRPHDARRRRDAQTAQPRPDRRARGDHQLFELRDVERTIALHPNQPGARKLTRAVIVEVDGRETHLTRPAFGRDRARDAKPTLAGYRVVRFTYRQVSGAPQGVALTLRALLGPRART